MTRESFQQALREHRHRVWSYVCYMLHDRIEAEDVTQEVYLRLWRHGDDGDSPRQRAWLLRVAHNLSIDVLRRRSSRPEAGLAERGIDLETMPAVAEETDPHRALERREAHQALLAAMSELPERTRSMLLLHYFQGLRHEAVSRILDTNVSAVKVALHRGRRRLRELLAPSDLERARKVPHG